MPTRSNTQAPTTKAKSSHSRKRLSPELRRAQILDAAAKLIVAQGFLPLPIEKLARAAGASKALIYAYFPTQYHIFNALIRREIDGLTTAGMDTATRVKDLDQAVLLSSMLYFEYVVQAGPLLHTLMTDLYMDGHIDRRLIYKQNKLLQHLVKLVRGVLPLSNQETRAVIYMLTTIPEQAGGLVYHKELDVTTARQLCRTLTLSGLGALRTGRVAVRGDHAARSMKHNRKT